MSRPPPPRRDQERGAIELLVLDVNGVLYHYDKRLRIEALARALDRPAEQIEEAIFTSGLEDAADAGFIGPDVYLDAVGERLQVDLDRITWRDALAGAVSPNEEVHHLLDSLRGRIPMVTLSNNGLLVKEHADVVYPEIADLGVEFRVAAELGDAKPSHDVFEQLCADFDVAPEATAFVDDKQKNVDGAARAGLQAHRFVDIEGFRTFLADIELVDT